MERRGPRRVALECMESHTRGLSVRPFCFAQTGLSGLDSSELVKARVVVGSFIFEL